MSDPKQLGAKAMLDQSVIYLYNSYRDQGMSKEEAQAAVAEAIADVQEKYAARDIIPKSSSLVASDPSKLLKEIVSDVEKLGINPIAKKHLHNKLLNLQRIMK